MSINASDIIKSFNAEERELFELACPEEQSVILERLERGELSAYVFGKKYFFKNYFELSPECLIPRPDTERVLEGALSLIPKDSPALVADLCTGSGCIGLSFLLERARSRCILCDISQGALSTARKNAAELGVADRTEFILCDLLNCDPLGELKLDLIISNPPYLTTREIGEYPDLASEPRIAFDGGEDGLIFYRRFLDAFGEHLKDDGAFVFEIGYAQAEAIRALALSRAYTCTVKRDYGGCDRVAILKKDKNN